MNNEGRDIDPQQVYAIITKPENRDRFPPKTQAQRVAAQKRGIAARLRTGKKWGQGLINHANEEHKI